MAATSEVSQIDVASIYKKYDGIDTYHLIIIHHIDDRTRPADIQHQSEKGLVTVKY